MLTSLIIMKRRLVISYNMVSKYLMTSLLKSKDEVYKPTEVVIFGVMIKVSSLFNKLF